MKFKKSVSKLEKVCTTTSLEERAPCDVAIDGASALYDQMISACVIWILMAKHVRGHKLLVRPKYGGYYLFVHYSQVEF